MTPSDPVSPSLRKIETEIDNYFKINLLTSKPFAEAAWNVLAFYEDYALRDLIQGKLPSIHEVAMSADYIVNHLQYPLRWLWGICSHIGEPKTVYDPDNYEAAFQLYKLAHDYDSFDSAFTSASQGIIELELDGTTIKPVNKYYSDPRYEAYDRLIKPRPVSPDSQAGDIFKLDNHILTVKKATFHYQLGKRLVHKVKEILEPIIQPQFELPKHWEFNRYSLTDFREVSRVLLTLAYIHYVARILAATKGCEGLCIDSCILVLTKKELLWKLVRYANTEFQTVEAIVEDFTYGGRGIKRLDPALQPIIPLSDNRYALMPNLLINSSMERNLISLLNRIPDERHRYLDLVNQKEKHLRLRIQNELQISGVRFVWGPIPGKSDLPDIDLAIIHDESQIAFLLELKWFLEPAEIREVIEKATEIQKGTEQLKKLGHAFSNNPDPFCKLLDIESHFNICLIVISQNIIGMDWNQDPEIPIIQVDHFVRKLNSMQRLRDMWQWLSNREYLPVEGKDFEIVETVANISQWDLEWYGINPLVEDTFDP